MTVNVSGVPTSIPFTQLAELCKGLGLDPNDVISLHIDRGGVTAEVWAVNEHGKRYVVGDEAARHTVAIPVTPSPDRFVPA